MDRLEVATALREIGALLALSPGNRFKARAYETGARSLEALNADLKRLVAEGRLKEVRGIGDALARTITELVRSGRSELLEQLHARFPEGVLELREVPGLTLRRIAALQKELGTRSVAELKDACVQGRVRTVKGFDEKLERRILEGIGWWESRGETLLLHQAEREAEAVLAFARSLPKVRRAEIAGSLRRCTETVDAIVIAAAVAAKDAKATVAAFARYPPAVAVVERTATGCVLRLGNGVLARVEFAVPSRFSALLLHLTGSPGHVARLESLARDRGMKLDRHGLWSVVPRRLLATGDEADFYQQLGLPFLPPEVREDAGEVEAAKKKSLDTDLLRQEEIVGIVHCHTQYSDGRNTIEEMARAAQAMGMQYITITDHSPTAHYAGGLTLDRLRAQWDEIAAVQERVKIKILRGTESDILADGSLDFPDRILEQLDVVIGSIHHRYKMDRAQMTERLVRAMRHPLFKIWGHALGRYVASRPPIECRVEEVLDAAAESRVAIEVNGDPHRLDMEPRWQREARRRGIPFVVSTDAHSIAQLQNLRFGVAMARRGWLTGREVLNTRGAEAFRAAVKPA